MLGDLVDENSSGGAFFMRHKLDLALGGWCAPLFWITSRATVYYQGVAHACPCILYRRPQVRQGGHFCAVRAVPGTRRSIRLT